MTTINLINDINEAYIPFFRTTQREAILYGGAGAGKSYSAAQKVILFSLIYREKKILVIRKTLPALKLTSLELVEKLLRQYHIPYDINKSDLIITTYGGNKIIFKSIGEGGEDIEKIKSITDTDLIWIEETTELTANEYDEINRRLRGQKLPKGHFRQIIMTFNPIDRNHWIYKRFFERETEAFKLKTTYKDNRFIDDDYKKVLEGLKDQDEYAYQVYCLGEWGTLKGQIYTNYSIESFDHSMDFYDDIIAGIDFGFNNPSVYLLIGLKDKEVYIIDEIYRIHLTMPEFIDLIKEKNKQWNVNPTIYSETDPQRITELTQAGFIVIPAKKDVVNGINFLKTLKIHIHSRCVNTIKEIQGYKYKEDRQGNILEEPVKFNDHSMDAMRYAVYTYYQSGNVNEIVYIDI